MVRLVRMRDGMALLGGDWCRRRGDTTLFPPALHALGQNRSGHNVPGTIVEGLNSLLQEKEVLNGFETMAEDTLKTS